MDYRRNCKFSLHDLRTTLHRLLSHPLTVLMVQGTDEQESATGQSHIEKGSVALGRRLSGVDCLRYLRTGDIFEPRCGITVRCMRPTGFRSQKSLSPKLARQTCHGHES